MVLNYLFFLFPFFLYLGIAVQGLSFYIICILAPSIFFLKQKKIIPDFVIKTAICLLLLHIIFPITNIINYLFPLEQFPNYKFQLTLKWPSILQSNFPSYLFIGTLLLLIFQFIIQKNRTNTVSLNVEKVEILPLKYFLTGLFPASILICLALIYQYNIGLDFHSFKGKYLEATEVLDNGKYRVNGFYGHPLTIAGVGLAYSIFCWSLLWLSITRNHIYNFDNIFIFKNKNIHKLALLVISLCNFIIVILSSGRTAGIACIFMLLLIPFLLGIKRKPFLTIITLMALIISSFFILKKSGLMERILFTTNSISESKTLDNGNYRQYFWKVYWQMFLDKPVVGHGNYWLKDGVRENYYNKMGFENLPEKYNAHNNYLEILASGGLLAFFWIITILGFLYKTLKNKINENFKEMNFLIFCYLSMFIANLIHALTQNVFFDSSVVYIYTSIIYVIIWHITFKEKNKT